MSKVTNYEYFKDEIIEMVVNGKSLAVVYGKPARCCETPCGSCGAHDACGETCVENLKAWLNAEHIEKPKLTKKERQFCELVETGWICRDKDETVWWLGDTPNKTSGSWCCCKQNHANLTHIADINFSFITWDDKEPWSVEELLKLEVED